MSKIIATMNVTIPLVKKKYDTVFYFSDSATNSYSFNLYLFIGFFLVFSSLF